MSPNKGNYNGSLYLTTVSENAEALMFITDEHGIINPDLTGLLWKKSIDRQNQRIESFKRMLLKHNTFINIRSHIFWRKTMYDNSPKKAWKGIWRLARMNPSSLGDCENEFRFILNSRFASKGDIKFRLMMFKREQKN